MPDQVYEIIVLVICFSGFIYACKLFKGGKIYFALVCLILSGLILRVLCSFDFFLHNWDERYHALVAKNLLKHPLIPTLYDTPLLNYNYKEWWSNHIWLHKQPLPVWLMAVSMKLFGVNEIAIRLPSIIASTIGIYLTYRIGDFFFSKKTGFIAAIFFSMNGFIVELTAGRTTTDHYDVFFLFFIELAIFFSILFIQKKQHIYNLLVGISIGAAILTKWMPALIVIPIWLAIVIDSKKFNRKSIVLYLILLVTVTTIVFLPWQIYIFQSFPLEARWEYNYNVEHLYTALEGHGGNWYYYFLRIGRDYGELIYLPILWFLFRFRNRTNVNVKMIAILFWLIIPFLFFSIAKTKMPGYILIISPVLFFVTAEFCSFIFAIRKNNKFQWLYSLILIAIFALPIRHSIERSKVFSTMDRNPTWAKDLKTLDKSLPTNAVLFNYKSPVEAMFYTDLIAAYPFLPDIKIIRDLQLKGYIIFINTKENIPADILYLKGIEFKKLNERPN